MVSEISEFSCLEKRVLVWSECREGLSRILTGAQGTSQWRFQIRIRDRKRSRGLSECRSGGRGSGWVGFYWSSLQHRLGCVCAGVYCLYLLKQSASGSWEGWKGEGGRVLLELLASPVFIFLDVEEFAVKGEGVGFQGG